MNFLYLINVGSTVARLASNLPWEAVFARAREPKSLAEFLPPELLNRTVRQSTGPESTPDPAPEPDEPNAMLKPGCTAADETLVIIGHLEGLARGKNHFGVLRSPDEHKRVQRAIAGARGMGADDVAERMEEVFGQLEHVSTSVEAAALAERLDPIAFDAAWELGVRCGGIGIIARAQHLMERAQAGEITKAEALAALREAAEE